MPHRVQKTPSKNVKSVTRAYLVQIGLKHRLESLQLMSSNRVRWSRHCVQQLFCEMAFSLLPDTVLHQAEIQLFKTCQVGPARASRAAAGAEDVQSFAKRGVSVGGFRFIYTDQPELRPVLRDTADAVRKSRES